jgi:uncharacterized protein (TIGR00369 family)
VNGGTREIRLCHGCSTAGRCRLGIDDIRFTDGTMNALAVCRDGEGARGVAHGGWIASVLDEVVGLIPESLGHRAVTGRLAIDYLRPVPIGRELEVTGWCESNVGRQWNLEGSMRLASTGVELARAGGVWIEIKDDHLERHAAWLEQQDFEGRSTVA